MPNKQIITGQKISPELKARANELRQRMTPAEKMLWERIKANRLEGYHFRRQQIIDGYIVDFYCHAVGLVIEVDGGIHQKQQADDRLRDEHLHYLGLTILRFLNTEVEHEMDMVLSKILEVCQAVNSHRSNKPF